MYLLLQIYPAKYSIYTYYHFCGIEKIIMKELKHTHMKTIWKVYIKFKHILKFYLKGVREAKTIKYSRKNYSIKNV